MSDPVAIEPLSFPVTGGEMTAYRLGHSHAEPVIAVHGITSNSRAWLAVARALSGAAGLVAPDLRGRGANGTLPSPYGSAAHVADAVALLDHLGCERAVLAGHSLGAYIVARLAVEHPERVRALVLVDGGLTIPGSRGADPQQFAAAFLGPALARLKLEFESREAYRQWWGAHPALIGADVAEADLNAYADHDLVGTAPHLRSTVAEAAVRADAQEFPGLGEWAARLRLPTTLLCAPRGLLDDPHPMQPLSDANRWAAARPERRAVSVEGVNHYTITLGSAGAAAVAETIAASVTA